MSAQRILNTRFWSDPFIQGLSPNERYLFLYFLTNEHTNIAGIYEMSMGTICFETGISEPEVNDILKKFNNKIVYYNGYIIVKNFYKHQSKSPKITGGIAIIIRELPDKIMNKLSEINFPLSSFEKEKIIINKLNNFRKTKPTTDVDGFAEIGKMIKPIIQ